MIHLFFFKEIIFQGVQAEKNFFEAEKELVNTK